MIIYTPFDSENSFPFTFFFRLLNQGYSIALMKMIMTLSLEEFSFIYDMLSLTIAVMGAFTLFFFLSRSQVLPQFRPALLVAGIVTTVSCFHYFQIFQSWNNAFELAGSSYAVSGHPFREAYRYVGWLMTIPLQLLAVLLFLGLSQQALHRLLPRYILTATGMVLCGYLAQTPFFGTSHSLLRLVLILLQAGSFLFIFLQLWKKLPQEIILLSAATLTFLTRARIFLLLTWLLYPLLAVISSLHIMSNAFGLVAITSGYNLADMISQCGLGLLIYQSAMAQSQTAEKNRN